MGKQSGQLNKTKTTLECLHLTKKESILVVMYRFKGDLSFNDAAVYGNSSEQRRSAMGHADQLVANAIQRDYAEVRVESRIIESSVILQVLMPGAISA